MSFPGLIEDDMEDLKQEFGGRELPPGYNILSDLIDNAELSLYELKKIGLEESEAYRIIANFTEDAEAELYEIGSHDSSCLCAGNVL